MNSESTLVFSPREKSTRIIVSLLGALLTFVLVFCVYLLDAYDELQEEGNELVDVIEAVHQDAKHVTDLLQELDYQTCDAGLLNYMEQQRKLDPFIKRITFHGIAKPCTTGSYERKQDIAITLPTKSGSKLSLHNSPQNQLGYSSYGVRYGDYEVVYSAYLGKTLVPEDYRYEIIHNADKYPVHLFGQQGIYVETIDSGLDWLAGAPFVAGYCSDTSYLCAALEVPEDEFYQQALELSLGALVICVLSSWFIYRRFTKFLLSKRAMSERIKAGLQKQSFYFLYQPIVDMKDKRVIGCEVLARFKDKYGEIYPDRFIPLLPELGITWQFTEYLIEHALAPLNQQRGLGDKFKVSINVFPQDISDNNIAQIPLNAHIRQANFQLQLEITEDQYLEQASAQHHLSSISQQGITIAIDDFGTGYSNLTLIKDIYANVLKIDRSFVVDLEEGAIRSSLIPNIKAIADKADLSVVAEGIENQQQYLALKELGIELGQGWLFGKPMPLNDLLAKVVCEQ